MKLIMISFLAAMLVVSSGCASMSAIHAAKRDSQGIPAGEGETPRPGYYFLLPLTVPIDVGTLPLQGIVYLMFGGIDC